MTPSLILINPWIYDFAAYDLWSKPLGLLSLAGYLRHCRFEIHIIDCLDVHHPEMKGHPSMKVPTRRAYGTGKFWRKEVPKPLPLKNFARPYSRYGISPKIFKDELRKIRDPAAILVTSLMTYWYPGVKEVISLAKEIHPGIPVILGGIYAKICRDHAIQYSGADRVVPESGPRSLLEVLYDYGICAPGPLPDENTLPYPAFDLLRRIDYICLLTSTGCPYRCRYCASHLISPDLLQRDPEEVFSEILFWQGNFDVQNFAFYDDALLLSAETHLVSVLEQAAKLNLNLKFHTPNAIHAREVTPDIAMLMYRTGFHTIRLGLETSDFSLHRDLDNKIGEGDFEWAVKSFLEAGFTGSEIGAYILIGLPGQSIDSVLETIDFVAKTGASPYLSEYSPIPHTALWKEAISHSRYPLCSEPLFHNNTLLPCWGEDQKKEIPRLKKRVLEIRQRYR